MHKFKIYKHEQLKFKFEKLYSSKCPVVFIQYSRARKRRVLGDLSSVTKLSEPQLHNDHLHLQCHDQH